MEKNVQSHGTLSVPDATAYFVPNASANPALLVLFARVPSENDEHRNDNAASPSAPYVQLLSWIPISRRDQHAVLGERHGPILAPQPSCLSGVGGMRGGELWHYCPHRDALYRIPLGVTPFPFPGLHSRLAAYGRHLLLRPPPRYSTATTPECCFWAPPALVGDPPLSPTPVSIFRTASRSAPLATSAAPFLQAREKQLRRASRLESPYLSETRLCYWRCVDACASYWRDRVA